ncbi:MAG TPA: hypothetical protein VNK24_03585 [Elusimicrobiota bacterium]|nr:hypothetical protein [Elusimicrobiota bacterium]
MRFQRAFWATAVAALAAWPGAARAQEVRQIRRGDIRITVHVHGTVITQNVITLTSTIPGRVEDIYARSTGTWALDSAVLGDVASAHLAAMLDSPTTTDKSVVLARWKSDYPLIPVRCPQDCYLLKISVRTGDWISSGDPLFTAAQTLRLTGVAPAGNAYLIRDGQWLTYWAKDNPTAKFRMPVGNFELDHPGEPENSSSRFAMDMAPGQYFPPGTAWEGVIIPVDHPNALLVPTAAVVEFGGELFLPMPVSTGITTAAWTEISAGAGEGEDYLMLKDSQLGKAQRHAVRTPAPVPAGSAAPQAQDSNAQPPSQQPDYGGDIYTQ